MLGKLETMFENPPIALSRRGFLKVVGLSGAGFMIGCGRPDDPAASSQAADATLGPFIRIGADDTVTVIVKHLDKGQGVTTGLPTIVAEELDADWSQMRAEFAPADVSLYAHTQFGPLQVTGGSSSVSNSWMQLRNAAAGARAMLVQAAADRWQVPAADLVVAKGVVSHDASGRRATFGELAAEAAGITPPDTPQLKDPARFTLVGSRLPRLDSASKTDGSALFTMDIDRPGMLTAVIAHPPKFGATVAAFDAAAARDVPGVTDVVETPRGVAVVASSFWAAKKGRDALSVEWDFSDAEQRGSEQMFEDYEKLLEADGLVARREGDVDEALAGGGKLVRSRYSLPFLAHATMEPMDCVVEIGEDGCEIWTGSQMQTVDQNVAAQILGIAPEQVSINTLFAGGSFGRRAVPDSDYVAEAVSIARGIGGRAPVKLVWTREDDMQGGRYRPMSQHLLEGAVDADGNITAWRHRTAVQSFMKGTPFEAFITDGIDPSAVEGSRSLPYAIPNLEVVYHPAENRVPTLWWRSVGHTQNGFVTEAFFDELARAAGRDPYEMRRALLVDHPRHLAVLELAAEKAGWGSDPGEGRGRGIAVHESFGSFVAQVVEVTLGSDGSFSVDRVVCAVDCGIAINPDVVMAQMEGGIGYALSAALREEIVLEDGAVQQKNFDRYRPLRIGEMPDVEVHIVPSAEAPTGVGEPGVPPLAPALVNALADAGARRIHRLPIGDQLKA